MKRLPDNTITNPNKRINLEQPKSTDPNLEPINETLEPINETLEPINQTLETRQILVLPGASGSLSKPTQELITKIPNTSIINCKWNTRSPSHHVNFEIINSNSKKQTVLICNSFSNRVVLEMIKQDKFIHKPIGFVFLGYPLLGPKPQPERIQLLEYSKFVKCSFISGTNDVFLNRPYHSKKGKDCLQEFVKTKPILFINNGNHSVPDCKGTRELKKVEMEKAVEFIQKFINSACL